MITNLLIAALIVTKISFWVLAWMFQTQRQRANAAEANNAKLHDQNAKLMAENEDAMGQVYKADIALRAAHRHLNAISPGWDHVTFQRQPHEPSINDLAADLDWAETIED